MASIRTIHIRKASIRWNTGMIRSLYFDHSKIEEMFNNVVKPGLYGKIKIHSDIRPTICKLIEEAIISGKVKSMLDWVNLVIALRLTKIDELNIEDNAFRVRFLIPYSESQERKTFWNIAWHMNHHCKQLYKCCFVQVTGSYASTYGNVALSYTTGEAYDRKNFFLDTYYEKDRHPTVYHEK